VVRLKDWREEWYDLTLSITAYTSVNHVDDPQPQNCASLGHWVMPPRVNKM